MPSWLTVNFHCSQTDISASKKMVKKHKKIIIEGITSDGRKFRPSDWAERMSGKMATYKNHRIKYSPLLQPSVTARGYKCILIDPSLRESNQALYQFLINFAEKNNLNICDEES